MNLRYEYINSVRHEEACDVIVMLALDEAGDQVACLGHSLIVTPSQRKIFLTSCMDVTEQMPYQPLFKFSLSVLNNTRVCI